VRYYTGTSSSSSSRSSSSGNTRNPSTATGTIVPPKVQINPHHNSGTVWERVAVAVKYAEQDTASTTTTTTKVACVNTIRATHDPVLHIKTIEDELKGTIGKALGRQGEKVLRFIRSMKQELQHYHALVEQHHHPHPSVSLDPTTPTTNNGMSTNTIAPTTTTTHHNHPDILQSAQAYNQYRQQALQARWELTVHRQAIGFIVNNHNYVTEHYPIPPPLLPPSIHYPTDQVQPRDPQQNDEDNSSSHSKGNHNNETFMKGQLAWWERVGRWR
jgi:hypothetical protein